MKIATYSLYMAEKQKDNYDFETLEFGDLKVGDLFAVKDEEKDKLLLFVKTEPFTVESFTIHTITPPSQTTLYNSFAIFSKSNEYPLYVLRPSYGGDVIIKSTLSSSRSLKPSKQSIL